MSGSFSLLLASTLRVASLDLCADEYLLYLAPEQAVSVSFLGADVQETALARRAKDIARNDGRIESLLSTRPDLLLTTRDPGPQRRAIAARAGMAIVTLDADGTPAAARRNMQRLGKMLGQPQRSGRWIKRLETMTRKRPRQSDAALWLGPGGYGGAHNGWLALAGYDSVSPAAGRGRLESLLASDINTLIVSDYRAGQYSRTAAWLDHPLVKAHRARRITVDGRAFTCGGPMALIAVEKLRR